MNNALHRAILADNYSAVKALAKSPLATEKDSWGFTPLELAYFLKKQPSINILSKDESRQIRVLKAKSSEVEILTPSQFKSFFKVSYCSYLYFQDYLFFQETLKNCPWSLAKSFLGAENRHLGALYQNELSKGDVADVTIQWIDQSLGYGLFANVDLPANTFIGEFTGLVRRLPRKDSNPNEYCFHYPTRFWSWNYTVVDAFAFGNETRFINHSDAPNVEPYCVCERNLLHIIFLTKTSIPAKTQLTYNYGQDFWRHRTKIST